MTQNPEESAIHGSVHHLNPETLHKNPAFTQVITVTGPAKTIYIGGQDAVDAQGDHSFSDAGYAAGSFS